MTIGEMNHDWSQGPNPDFTVSRLWTVFLLFLLINKWERVQNMYWLM